MWNKCRSPAFGQERETRPGEPFVVTPSDAIGSVEALQKIIDVIAESRSS